MDSAKAAKEAQQHATSAASSAESELKRAIETANKVESVEIARITALETRLSKKILWGVNSKDEIFWSNDEGKSWHNVEGRLKHISV